MSLISTKKISKNFGDRDLFTDLSLHVPEKSRIGLVGRNGIGKTTLLEIMGGVQAPSSGEINYSRGLKIGYLPQVSEYDSEETLWEFCVKEFASLKDLADELSLLEKQLEKNSYDTDLLNKYAQRQEAFERIGGYTFEVRISQVLSGLGFRKNEFTIPVKNLSGGQRTRALFASLILSDPNVLLLDEPTNYLDVRSIEWLESYLKDWAGAAVIISHDRYFLDQVVNVIWELDADLELYHGNYSAYTMQREESYKRRLEEFKRQKKFIEKEQEYIRRNISGQNTRQAQGRRTRLERMIKESRQYKPVQAENISLRIEASHRSGDQIIKTSALEVGYKENGKPLFTAPDLLLSRGECVALIGPNGAGKTTFIKTILGQIPPFRGAVEIGSSLVIGYFEQAHQSLNPENTVMQEIEQTAPQMLPEDIRKYLARYQFKEDDVFLKVSVLSGGERARLALAILSLQNANLLLLDEPTSHLDISSQEILQTILESYNGTIILVSHDRYLIAALATQIWEISSSQSNLLVFKGSYEEYKANRMISGSQELALSKKDKVPDQKATKPSKAKLKQKAKRLQVIEEKIDLIEEKMKHITSEIESSGDDFIKVQKLGNTYSEFEKELEALFNEWDCISKG